MCVENERQIQTIQQTDNKDHDYNNDIIIFSELYNIMKRL